MRILTILFLIYFVHLEAEVSRIEETRDFKPILPDKTVRVDKDLLEIDVKKDIPELFEQKFTMSENTVRDSVEKEVNGFRIQIFKTEDLTEAKTREAIYINNFGEENLVLIFEPPFYKIRVGRLRDREEAEQYQEELRNRGFNNTIIVPDIVKLLVPSENNTTD